MLVGVNPSDVRLTIRSRRRRQLQTNSFDVDAQIITPEHILASAETAANIVAATPVANLSTLLGVTITSADPPLIESLAFEAPSPPPPSPPPPSPPPSPPPPSPPIPPHGCTVDFLRASSYYQDLDEHQVVSGSDGNLIHEFMEVERIMHEASLSITADNPHGDNNAYVCRVLSRPFMECLDLAGSSTLQSKNGVSTFNSSYSEVSQSALNGVSFMHANTMIDIATAATYNVSNLQLFGIVSPCAGEALVGDGAINAFDAFVIAALQFGMGPYADISRDFANVPTVSGRNDTKDRCTDASLGGNVDTNYTLSRLDWMSRAALLPCYTYDDEDAYQLLAADSSRQLQSIEMGRWSPQRVFSLSDWPVEFNLVSNYNIRVQKTSLVKDYTPNGATTGWSKFGIYDSWATPLTFTAYDSDKRPTAQHENVLVEYGTTDTPMANPLIDLYLNGNVFEYARNEYGTWFWINVPGVHISFDLTLFGAVNEQPICLSNVRAPRFNSNDMPIDASQYELRYIRHREFYDLPVDKCANLGSARTQLAAMERSVISVAQVVDDQRTMLCGVDFMLWKPLNTPVHTGACSVALAAGSATMSTVQGLVQRKDACAVSLFPNSSVVLQNEILSPPPPAQPPSSPKTTTNSNDAFTVSMVVGGSLLTGLAAIWLLICWQSQDQRKRITSPAKATNEHGGVMRNACYYIKV